MEILIILSLMALSLLILLRNHITLSLMEKWMDDIYKDRTKGTGQLQWGDLPVYSKVMIDFTIWKYIPLKDYLGRKNK